MRSRLGSFNENHPELREGEVFVGNIEMVHFVQSEHKTKRLGYQAYMRNGTPMRRRKKGESWHSFLYPMFVQRSELEEKGLLPKKK